jgi:hypothetical protein
VLLVVKLAVRARPVRGYPFAARRWPTAILAGAAAPARAAPGGLPERPMGAVCKTVAKASEVRILHPPPPGGTAPDLRKHVRGPRRQSPVESSRIRSVASASGPIVGRFPVSATLLLIVHALIRIVSGRPSRRAGLPRPGRVRPVEVERPAGRPTWTGRTRSGCLRCAAGTRAGPAAIPERPGPGLEALAAGGPARGPRSEAALAAGGAAGVRCGEHRGDRRAAVACRTVRRPGAGLWLASGLSSSRPCRQRRRRPGRRRRGRQRRRARAGAARPSSHPGGTRRLSDSG